MSEKPAIEVKQVENGDHRGAFVVERDGKRLAEMTYTMSADGPVIIEHTEVSDVLRGQGVGGRLVGAFVAWARNTHRKVIPLCPFARAVFDKDPSIHDVLSD